MRNSTKMNIVRAGLKARLKADYRTFFAGMAMPVDVAGEMLGVDKHVRLQPKRRRYNTPTLNLMLNECVVDINSMASEKLARIMNQRSRDRKKVGGLLIVSETAPYKVTGESTFDPD